MSKGEEDFRDAVRRMEAAKLVTPTQDPAETMRRLRDDLDNGVFDAQQELLAQIALARYRAYIKVGFSEAQALYLVGLRA